MNYLHDARVKAECASKYCNKPGQNKCIVCNTRYCSRDCQKSDWTTHKKKCRQPHVLSTESELCYRDLTIEEELVRGKDAFKVESDFYMYIDKDRKRDRVSDLQMLLQKSFGNGGDSAALEKDMIDELKREYLESLSVEPNDSGARLGYKVAIHSVVVDILKQMNAEVFSPAEEKAKELLILDAFQIKLQRLVDLTEIVRLKICPTLKEIPNHRIETIRNKILEKKGKPKGPINKNIPRNKPAFYPGPPGWLFLEGLPKVKELFGRSYELMFRNTHTQREIDSKHRFYCFNYPNANYCISSPELKTALPFSEHCRFHRIGGASVTVTAKAEALLLQDNKKMTVQEFNNLSGVTILLPHVIVGSCDYCKAPAVGECICGECYCSAACHTKHWPDHQEICHQVLDNNVALTIATPLSWGEKPYKLEEC